MSKRTIDADKLYDFLEDYAPPHDEEYPGDWRSRIDAAFPIAEPAHTHNLVPLPESEWPEWAKIGLGHFEVYGIGNDLFLVRHKSNDDWLVFDDAGAIRRSPVWQPTPAAALEAAGLPVELLEGIGRKSGVSSDDRAQIGRESSESNDSQAISDDLTNCSIGGSLGGPPEYFPSAKPTPAHENPRVVAAAVEMVKEVEQHKAKAAKDREEWLAQFPYWVRSWQRENRDAMPLRMIDDDNVAVFTPYLSSGHQFAVFTKTAYEYGKLVPPSMPVLVDVLNGFNLYADGNVPLWGDVAGRWPDDEEPFTVVRIDGDKLYDTPTDNWHGPECHLVRRHPAIADLPGIRNDSSADRSDSNDSAGEVTGYPQVELREGQRVTCEARYPNSVGFLVDHDPGSGRLEDRNTVCFGGTTWDTFRDDELTAIPPPLTDNGDGTWTMEGYSMFRIEPTIYGHVGEVWQWSGRNERNEKVFISHVVFSTKEAAALDLFERMEGVR